MGHLANLDPSTKDSQWDLIYKVAAALRSLVTGGGSGSSGGAVSNATSSSTTLENSRGVTAGASGLRCFDIMVFSRCASDQYLMVFDAAATPANGTFSPLVALIPAGFQGGFSWATGRPFTTGIRVCNSTTSNALTIGAADCEIDINYRS